jgi:cellulose synthase/poly-beta-1,6-N-acetylglucosamine synthase-like glycosyltransferase
VSRLSSSPEGSEGRTILLNLLFSTVVFLTLVPVLVLFVQVLAAATGRSKPANGGRQGRLAIVIPAHDEALGIAATLRALIPQLAPHDRLIVVADNCSDDTANVARQVGAEVIVRTDTLRRGKGYALDFGVRHLESEPPDIALIVDADCEVTPGALDALAATCSSTARPVQSLYLMHAPPNAGLKTRIAEFAWVLRNQVRPLGLRRLGLPCQLMGSGMAFPWECLRTSALATGHIVEDLKLGIDLARGGHAPLFCPEALVTSQFPDSTAGLQSQRTRWEHGHLGVIFGEAPRLLLESILQRRLTLLALALDLSVPPLALLALQLLLVWLGAMGLYAFTRAAAPLGLATLGVVMFGVAVITAWWRFARHVVSLASLAWAPIYVLWKIPLYAKFLVSRQIDWVRSKRDGP